MTGKTRRKTDSMKIISTKKSVEQILKLHAEILDAVRTSLPKAIKIGELLTGIKDKMEHGQWLPWVQKNLPFAERTVRNYCRCFAERDKLKSANVADLSGAYILLSEPKTELAPLPPMDFGRAAKAAELDAQIIKSIADVKTTATDFADGELPPGFIAREGFEAFIKSRGVFPCAARQAPGPGGTTLVERGNHFGARESIFPV